MGLGLCSTCEKGCFTSQHSLPCTVPVPLLLLQLPQSRAARRAPTSLSSQHQSPSCTPVLVGSAGRIVPFMVCFII